MAVVIKRVQTLFNTPLNTITYPYTVPAGKRTIIRSIFQGNDGATTDSEMGVSLRGVGYLWNQKVSQYDSRTWALSTVMYAGDQIGTYHTNGSQYTIIQLAEMDEAEGANLWKVDHFSVTQGTTQLYTVPAGKKVRIREAVVCNHGDTANYELFIDGVCYLDRIATAPRVGNVLGQDITMYAGERLGSRVTGPAGHVFYSGVIEDA